MAGPGMSVNRHGAMSYVGAQLPDMALFPHPHPLYRATAAQLAGVQLPTSSVQAQSSPTAGGSLSAHFTMPPWEVIKCSMTAQGKHVVELGCGCGLVGLCLAAHGAHVLLTDLPEPLVRASLTPLIDQCMKAQNAEKMQVSNLQSRQRPGPPRRSCRAKSGA